MTTEEKLQLVLQTADEAKANRVETIPLEGKTLLADYFVICSGNSDVHVRAIAGRIQEAMEKGRVKSGRVEGYSEAVWVLLDYGDVVTHVMRDEQRERYNLEDFWRNAPAIEELRTREGKQPGMSQDTGRPFEREDIEKQLRELHFLVKQDRRNEATLRARALTEEHPRVPAFWEAYGDLLMEAEQLEEARDAYFEAKEIIKPLVSAERKYADAVYRINMRGMPVLSEDPPANPAGAAMLSAVAPGAGQYLNREYKKAVIFFSAWIVVVIPLILIWTDSARASGPGRSAVNNLLAAITGGAGLFLLCVYLLLVCIAAADAYGKAKRENEALAEPIFLSKVKPTAPDVSFFDEALKEIKQKQGGDQESRK